MNGRIYGRWAAWIATPVVFVLMVGCDTGPGNLAPVKGTVTLDGQPLADARVMFTPNGQGAPSAGRTNASGVYTLVYSQESEGAEIGEHTVRISTYSSGDPDGDPPQPEVPEKVPAKYNSKTELTATVTAGSNSIDFPLQTEGETAQPKESKGEVAQPKETKGKVAQPKPSKPEKPAPEGPNGR